MKNSLFVICILWILSGCTIDKSIDSALDHAHELMLSHPDSSLLIIQNINRGKITIKKSKARYSLLYSQALDKNWIDVDNDSLIRYAVDYYKKRGNDTDRANAYYYQGIVYYNRGDVDKAMNSLVMASIYADKTDDHYIIGLIYNTIGNLYYEQCSFEEAERMYTVAIKAFSKTGNKQNILYALQSKGLSLVYLYKYQEASVSLQSALELAVELEDTNTLLDIVSSLGGLQAKMRDGSALSQINKEYLFQTYKRYTNNIIPDDHLPTIGYFYLQEKKIDSARFYFKKYLDTHPDISETNRGIFAVLSTLEQRTGNYKKALEYESLFSYYTDSINLANKNILIQHLEKKFKTEYLQKSFDTLQAKRKYENIAFVLAITIIIICIGILFVIYKRTIVDRNRQIAENENYIKEVQTYYSVLQEKYDNLLTNAKEQDNEKLQALLGILDNRILSLRSVLDMASKYENDTTQFFSKFKEHVRVASGNNIELAKDVISIANLSCYGIINHLKELYPKLTERELCYCGFICLGFSPDSIRVLYNHTNAYSIYTMRSKIRSKMGITNSTLNLEAFILKILDKLNA